MVLNEDGTVSPMRAENSSWYCLHFTGAILGDARWRRRFRRRFRVPYSSCIDRLHLINQEELQEYFSRWTGNKKRLYWVVCAIWAVVGFLMFPNIQDRARCMEYEEVGFPWCKGSMDATHVLSWERILHDLHNPHTAFKSHWTARTYNMLVNSRRMANGYHAWACTVPPMKITTSSAELRFSRWSESLRKDVECTFGIPKGRFAYWSLGFACMEQKQWTWFGWRVARYTTWWLSLNGLDVSERLSGIEGEFTWDDIEDAVPLTLQRLYNPGQLRTSDTSAFCIEPWR